MQSSDISRDRESSLPRFDGQVALVTGSTQGLGETIAETLVARGLSGLVVTGRNEARGRAVAERLSRTGCDVLFVPADLSSHAQVVALMQACDDRFKRIDVLVNAAGNTDRGTISIRARGSTTRSLPPTSRHPSF